jgi:predicted nucleic acid-binding Zn ribbon protein
MNNNNNNNNVNFNVCSSTDSVTTSVCGWCGTDITDGMEFCSETCRDMCIDAYRKDMALQQETYDAGMIDVMQWKD